MKILVVCQHYYPENFQITPICEELVKRGNDITVLCGLPNYPKGIVPDEYKKGHRDEYINGVHVVRSYEKGRKKGGPISLFLNYLSFWWSASRKVNKLDKDFDVVFCYQLSPITMGFPARKYAKKHKVPLITYVCDLWPESMKMYIKSETNPVYKLLRKISYKFYNSSDKLLCQSSSFIDYLRDYHHVNEDKLHYLPAFADDAYLTQDFTNDNGMVDFVFLGNLGKAQNLISILKSIKIIRELKGFNVHFVGEGSCLDDMKKFVADNGLNDIVKFYGRRPVEEMPEFYKLADVCLVSLKADNAVGLTMPAKVQGYMAAGKPILGMIEGSAEKVIREANCGVCVKSDDIEGFANAMEEFVVNQDKYKDYGKNGRVYFKNNFIKDKFIISLEEYLMFKWEKE